MSTYSNSIQTTLVKTSTLRPNDKPLRRHSRAQHKKLTRLFQLAGGQPIPIIVTADFNIIDGHAIYEHLRKSGAAEALVTILHSTSNTDARALRLILNRLVEDTRWNASALKLEIGELFELGYDLNYTGFDSAELEELLRLDPSVIAPASEDTELQSSRKDPIAKIGDIFRLGNHRLGCGDIL